MKREGAERRGSAWLVRAPGITTVIDLQKSSYGPSFYCNTGFWIATLGDLDEKRPKASEAHVHVRAEVLFEANRHRVAALLDAQAPMDMDERTAGLCELIRDHLLPFCSSVTGPDALRGLYEDGTLSGAAVRAPAYELFHGGEA
jgi:hypothetical protein